MSMNRHQHFEELISASLAGDLSDAERTQLDAHLDSCPACRATLASFADQRRIMAGLRHVAAPRDLGARVRAGVEGGAFAPVPWWRRPAVMFGGLGGGLAATAGVLLALVILNTAPDDSQVGVGSGSPLPSVSLAASSSPAQTPAPSATPVASEPAASPSASAAPIEASPEPDVYLAYTGPFDNLALTVRHGPTGETIAEVDTPLGPPVAAELSPDGQWLAYITEIGQRGLNDVRVTRIAEGIPSGDPDGAPPSDSPLDVGTTVVLGESAPGSPFLEVLSWSPDSSFLAYTIAGGPDGGTDVWLFEAAVGEERQLTDTGSAYAGSWLPGVTGGAMLWVSVAAETPASHLIEVRDDSPTPALSDPAADAAYSADGAFQPLVSPDGSLAIYWQGVMQRSGDEWAFVEGGAPYIGGMVGFDGAFEFTDSRPLFGDVTIDRDAFTSAAIVWGADSDAYAVWDAEWTGIPQGAGGEYPNINRVYFGHATDSRGLTAVHAIDETDVREGAVVVDVKVPTGRHLLITARNPVGGIMEAPTADLLLVTRNTGDVPDEVFPLPGGGQVGWFGPAAYDAFDVYRETIAP